MQFAGRFSHDQYECHSAEPEKPLSMCFHISRTHCEFSPWPHFYYGHWTLCRACAQWLQESLSCGIHDLQLCLPTTPGTMSGWGNFYFVAYWVPASSLFFFFFLHSLCKHTEVRLCVLWHDSIYSPTVTCLTVIVFLFFRHMGNIKKQSIWWSFARPERKWFSNKPQLPLNMWKRYFFFAFSCFLSNTHHFWYLRTS